MGLELSDIVRLPSDLQPLAEQRVALKSKILEEAGKKTQLSETAAKESILQAVSRHLPQAVRGYTLNQPFSTFDALLTTTIAQFNSQRSYAITRVLFTDANSVSYDELVDLQNRLANATIVKATLAHLATEKVATTAVTEKSAPIVAFSAPKKPAAAPQKRDTTLMGALMGDLRTTVKGRRSIEVSSIEQKLEAAKAVRNQVSVEPETLEEIRLKNQLKKAQPDTIEALEKHLEDAKKVREQHTFYATHLQNLRKTAYHNQPSIQADDEEAEQRSQQYKKSALRA